MTATNVTIDNLVDYSSQLNNLSSLGNIVTELQTLNTNLVNVVTALNQLSTSVGIMSTSTVKMANTLTSLANTADLSYNYSIGNNAESTYFANAPVQPELTIGAIWTGTVTTLYLNTSTYNSKVQPGYRIQGRNIDVDTFVNTISGLTLTIDKPTLGSSSHYNKISFYIT
jgi:hypothetical protein